MPTLVIINNMRKLGIVLFVVLFISVYGNAQDSSKVEVPNIFTPNSDGINDVFRPSYKGIKSVNGYIYNRWGEVIFQWWGLKGYWDGVTFPAGVEVPSGTYFYIVKGITFSDKEIVKSGVVTLKR